jgi:hypothetical protein
VLGALAAIFTALAALFGLVAWGKSYFEGKTKDAAFETFKRESNLAITDAQTRLAEAKTALSKQEAETLALRKEIIEPRHFTPEAMVRARGILDCGPKASANIEYVEGNLDARVFASMIRSLLESSGWTVLSFEPHKAPVANPGTLIVSGFDASSSDINAPTPANAFKEAFNAGVPETGRLLEQWDTGNANVPIRIIVGPKL